jgi:hypothetical protein
LEVKDVCFDDFVVEGDVVEGVVGFTEEVAFGGGLIYENEKD